MKSIEHAHDPAPEITDRNSCVIRLERMNRELLDIRKKLGSYTCEPKTLTLFEHYELLKKRVESLRRMNIDLILALREHREYLLLHWKGVQQQFQDFHNLENEVQRYMEVARN
ncbi:MAG: hypothetical protein V7724_11320 [Sediminicola sp.]